MKRLFLQYLPAMVAAVGGAMFGVDTGIVATTIGHDSFNYYMFPPTGQNAALTGAVVSVYNAGQAVGTFLGGWCADKFSRKRTMTIACCIAMVGILLQTASVEIGMFITGRLLVGWSSGMLLPVVPCYISEISKPQNRAIVVGFQGVGIAIGFMLANWIGYGGIFAQGNLQWRIPLAMQFPLCLVLLFGSLFIPFSPRWLMSKDRHEEARAVLEKVHSDVGEDYINREIIQIRDQIALERTYTSGGWFRGFLQLFERRYAKRVALSCFTSTITQFAGVSVIQNFQSIFYASVGFTGDKGVLIAGIYGFMGLIGQIISVVFVADRWGRKTTLYTGNLVLTAMLAVCMGLSAQYAGGTNMDASKATIAFIFLYSCFYAIFFNSTTWVVSAELLPLYLRSKGLGFATFCQSAASIILSQISPVALENISWRYYAVFIASNLLGAFVFAFILPETKGKSLEEIGELFGDTVAAGRLSEIDVDANSKRMEIASAEQVENIESRKAD